MKRIVSFAGMIIAVLILLAVIYLIPEPTTVGKTLTLLGTILALVNFVVWIKS